MDSDQYNGEVGCSLVDVFRNWLLNANSANANASLNLDNNLTAKDSPASQRSRRNF